MLIYVVVSFTFLTLGYITRQHIELGVFTTTLIEGLFIGGWVFLWEAFSLFFFLSQKTHGRSKRYNRFLNTPINL